MKAPNYIPYFLLVFALALSACASGEDPEGDDNNEEFRPEPENPISPGPDGGSVDDGGSGQEDLGDQEDLGGGDQTDMGGGQDDGGMDGCPANSCTPGTTRCQGDQIQDCVADPDNSGCGLWDAAELCPDLDQVCTGGQCETATSCVDPDNDGYGPMCAAGTDCDNSDGTVHPGATEVCDGIDNDCDSEVDEGQGVGMSCTTGTGACESQGTTRCDASGMIICDAPPPTGQPELCDGLDNDCDQMIDEDGACDFCAMDPFEPNETLATSSPVTVNTRTLAASCPGDLDFLDLPTSTGTYRIYITFPHDVADLDLHLYENGSKVFSSEGIGSEHGIQFTPQSAGDDFQVEIENLDQIGNFYYVTFLDTWACPAEDGFSPNTTLAEAPYFPPGWRKLAWVCDSLSDFYDMGEIDAGKSLKIDILDQDQWGDADLYLWGDPDGDGNFEVVEQSAGFATDETVSYTVGTKGRFYFEVRDFDDIGDGYEMVWNAN